MKFRPVHEGDSLRWPFAPPFQPGPKCLPNQGVRIKMTLRMKEIHVHVWTFCGFLWDDLVQPRWYKITWLIHVVQRIHSRHRFISSLDELWSRIFIQIISTHPIRHYEFSKCPGGAKRWIPKASGATSHLLRSAWPLTHYGPDEYLVTHRVVDVNVIRCFPSSGEFWTNHVRRTKLKVWFL